MDLKNFDKEEFIQKYKTNSMVKGGVIAGFLLVSWVIGDGFNFIFALAGLGLGYLAYNDHVDDQDLS